MARKLHQAAINMAAKVTSVKLSVRRQRKRSANLLKKDCLGVEDGIVV